MFFFFQAEDGIRDIGVTGVQTCALPIYRADRLYPGIDVRRPRRDGRPLPARLPVGGVARAAHPADVDADVRSEERRVGKECRSRWSTHYYKKTTYSTPHQSSVPDLLSSE